LKIAYFDGFKWVSIFQSKSLKIDELINDQAPVDKELGI